MLKEKIEYNLHFITIFLSLFFSLLAYLLNVPFEQIELLFALLITIGLVLATIWDANKTERDEKTEFRQIATFVYGELKVKSIGRKLEFHNELLVINPPRQSANDGLGRQIEHVFQRDTEVRNLHCDDFVWKIKEHGSSSTSQVFGNHEFKSQNKPRIDWIGTRHLNESQLAKELEAKKAVLVYLDDDVRKHAQWVYELVHRWSLQHPNRPVLFVSPDGLGPKKEDKIPAKYYWIPEDAATIPWRLLRRSRKRTDGWEAQAHLARSLWKYACTSIVVIYTLLAIMYFTLSGQNEILSREKFVIRAENARASFLAENRVTGNVDVAIFTDHQTFLQKPLVQEGSSDEKSNYTSFWRTSESVVGCAFLYPNRYVSGKEGDPYAHVFDRNGVELLREDNGKPLCTTTRRAEDTWRSIFCFTFATGFPAKPVGICLKDDPRTDEIKARLPVSDFDPYRNWMGGYSEKLFGLIEAEKRRRKKNGHY